MNNELLQQYIKANPKWKLKDVVVQLMYDQIINLKILPATKLNINQLQKALVGQSFGENKFISTTTNDFSNAPSSAQNLFKNRAVKINYKAKANVQGLLMPIGAGGDQGEMVLAPTNGSANKAPKITAVRMTGQNIYRVKTGKVYPQIEIDVEWD